MPLQKYKWTTRKIIATSNWKPVTADVNVVTNPSSVSRRMFSGPSPLTIKYYGPAYVLGVIADKGKAPDARYGTAAPGQTIKRFSFYDTWGDSSDYKVDFIMAPPQTIGTLSVKATEGGKSIRAVVQGAGTAQFSTPFTVRLRVGTYILVCTKKPGTKPTDVQTKVVNVEGGITKETSFEYP